MAARRCICHIGQQTGRPGDEEMGSFRVAGERPHDSFDGGLGGGVMMQVRGRSTDHVRGNGRGDDHGSPARDSSRSRKAAKGVLTKARLSSTYLGSGSSHPVRTRVFGAAGSHCKGGYRAPRAPRAAARHTRHHKGSEASPCASVTAPPASRRAEATLGFSAAGSVIQSTHANPAEPRPRRAPCPGRGSPPSPSANRLAGHPRAASGRGQRSEARTPGERRRTNDGREFVTSPRWPAPTTG